MKAMKKGALVAVLLASLAGCAKSEGPSHLDPELSLALGVERYLAPGTVKVLPFTERPASEELGTSLFAASSEPGGATLAALVLQSPVLDADGRRALEAVFTVSAGGAVARASRPAALDPLDWSSAGSLEGPGGGLVAECADVARGLRLENGAVVEGPSMHEVCARIVRLGPSVVAGRVARAQLGAGELALGTLELADGTVGPEVTVPVPSGASVLAVAEVEAGRVAAILQTATAWTAVDGMGATRTAPAPAVSPTDVATLRVDGTRFLLFTRDGAGAAWDPFGTGGEPTSLVAPTAPEGSAWRAGGSPGAAVAAPLEAPAEGREAESLSILLLEGDSLVSRRVSPTPCGVAADCRRYGTSHLRAVLDLPSGRLGVWGFWAWTGPVAFYVSPLSLGGAP